MSAQMRELLKAMGQKDVPEAVFILEINPEHPVVKGLDAAEDNGLIDDISHLLYEQALLLEGASLKDPAEFNARLNRVMAKVF
jgi:molecular chaperone HtpG